MKKQKKNLMFLAVALVLCMVTLSGCGQIAKDAIIYVLKEINKETNAISETEEKTSVSEETAVETEAEEEDDGVWAACTPANSVPEKNYVSNEERREARRSAEFSAFRDAMSEFTPKTASELLKGENGNSCYSPASLYLALGAATGGAEGETREQLLTLLGFSEEEELAQACNKACLALCQDAESDEKGSYLLQIAFSIWMNQDYIFKEDYKEHAAKEYFAELFQADYSDPQLATSMAKWVKKHTGSRINPRIEVSQDHLLTLMNTVHYHDNWADSFSEERTEPDVFHCGDGTEITCDFMYQYIHEGRFYRGINFTKAVLPCKNSDLTILLPNEGVDVHTFLESPESLEDSLFFDLQTGAERGDWQRCNIKWRVPKFSFCSNYNLVEMLNRLGVTDAFYPERADFSAMTEEPAFFSEVKQDTYIGIDEKGIEGAAFTKITMMQRMAPPPKVMEEKEMILDRPFLYMISVQDVPLFVGVCEIPTESNGN